MAGEKMTQIVTGLSVIFIVGLYLYGTYNVFDDNGIFDSFCQKKGYNKSTDYREINRGAFVDHVLIECDKVVINEPCEYERVCLDYDKWGECLDYERALDCPSGRINPIK